MVILELILELFIHGFTTFTLIQNQQQKIRYGYHNSETKPNSMISVVCKPFTKPWFLGGIEWLGEGITEAPAAGQCQLLDHSCLVGKISKVYRYGGVLK